MTSSFSSKLSSVYRILSILLSTFLIFATFQGVASKTSEAQTNDLLAVSQFLSRVFAGNYDWSRFFIDCTIGSHCQVFPFLWHLFCASFWGWSVKLQLVLAACLKIVNTLLILILFSSGMRKSNIYLMAPIALALQFGSCVTSVTYYNHSAIGGAIDQFGLVICLVSTTFFRSRAWGALLVFMGGLLSSYTCGASVVSVWLPVLASMILNKVVGKVWYLVWTVGFFVSALGLFAVAHISREAHAPKVTIDIMQSAANFISLIGLPLCSHSADGLLKTSTPFWFGVAGIVTFVFSLFLNIRNRLLGVWSNNALLLVLAGLMSASAVCLFRPALSAWYCVFTLPFWLCCAQLLISIITSSSPSDRSTNEFVATKAISVSVLLTFATIYCLNSRTYLDKDPYLLSHSLCAESALRNYEKAPTTAELLLFRFHSSDVKRLWEMGEFLERHNLACSGLSQVWTMQGDEILETVAFDDGGQGKPYWSCGPKFTKQCEFSSPEHLTLCLPPRSGVTWTVELPSQDVLESADLLLGGINSSSVRVEMFACIEEDSCKPKRLLSTERQSLISYAGKKIGVSLASNDKGNGKVATIASPRILVKLKDKGRLQPLKISPVNTDLAADVVSQQYPRLLISDGKSPLSDSWNLQNWKETSGSRSLLPANSSADLSLLRPLNQSSDKYTHFFFQLAVPEEQSSREACVQVITKENKLKQQVVPLLPDGGLHTYYCNLSHLGLKDSEVIQFVHFLPCYQHEKPTSAIKIGEIGFVRKLSLGCRPATYKSELVDEKEIGKKLLEHNHE